MQIFKTPWCCWESSRNYVQNPFGRKRSSSRFVMSVVLLLPGLLRKPTNRNIRSGMYLERLVPSQACSPCLLARGSLGRRAENSCTEWWAGWGPLSTIIQLAWTTQLHLSDLQCFSLWKHFCYPVISGSPLETLEELRQDPISCSYPIKENIVG